MHFFLAFTEADFMRLWKGLFYCVSQADRGTGYCVNVIKNQFW